MKKENPTLNLLEEHSSTRSFHAEALTPEEIDAIISATHRAPTSFNGQQVTMIITQDQAKKEKIAELAGGQPWIAQAPLFITFVMDFTKTNAALELEGNSNLIHRDIEGVLAASLDAGIALSNAMIAARSLGLGVVPIGGVRGNPEEMIKLLELPALTFPAVGLAIGRINKPSNLKPRLPRNTFVHAERYDQSKQREYIEQYNQTLIDHWKKTGRSDGQAWSKSLTPYSKIYFPKVAPTLIKQGFSWQLNQD